MNKMFVNGRTVVISVNIAEQEFSTWNPQLDPKNTFLCGRSLSAEHRLFKSGHWDGSVEMPPMWLWEAGEINRSSHSPHRQGCQEIKKVLLVSFTKHLLCGWIYADLSLSDRENIALLLRSRLVVTSPNQDFQIMMFWVNVMIVSWLKILTTCVVMSSHVWQLPSCHRSVECRVGACAPWVQDDSVWRATFWLEGRGSHVRALLLFKVCLIHNQLCLIDKAQQRNLNL